MPSPRATVVVVSSSALANPDENRTGPVAEQGFAALGLAVTQVLVGNEATAIVAAVREAVGEGAQLVLTCGGTGVRCEEVTVEATRGLLAFEIPGICEEVRRRGAEHTPLALLSRGTAGIIDDGTRRALLVNAPGSRGGVRDTITVLEPLLKPLFDDLAGAPRA